MAVWKDYLKVLILVDLMAVLMAVLRVERRAIESVVLMAGV